MQTINRNIDEKAAELRDVLKIIQYTTNKTLAEIAADIGRTQPTISGAANGKHDPTAVLLLLKEKYADLLTGRNEPTDCQAAAAMAKVTLEAVAELLAVQRGQSVAEVLRMLERQVDQTIQTIK